jgi:hypothetical protein
MIQILQKTSSILYENAIFLAKIFLNHNIGSRSGLIYPKRFSAETEFYIINEIFF